MKWISVKDRLPDKPYTIHLAYIPTIGIMMQKWIGADDPDRPYDHHGWKLPYPVTHWMPLPDKPHPDDEWIQQDYDNMVNRMWIPKPKEKHERLE